MEDNNVSKKLLSVSEAAEILGYSRQHTLRLINTGDISAKKVGRSYIVERSSLGGVYKGITPKEKTQINSAVKKIVHEYGDALKKLGKE